MKNTGTILVVEDIDEDFGILRWAFEGARVGNYLKRCSCSRNAIDFLAPSVATISPPPASLVLLDLNLPDVHDIETLQQIRCMYNLAELPVIVYSTSSSPTTIRSCYTAGATSYVIKPLDLDSVEAFVRAFCDWWLKRSKCCRASSECMAKR